MSESASTGVGRFIEAGCLRADPVPWLLASDEPYAVWVTLTALLDRADTHAIAEVHDNVLADPGVAQLIAELPEWGVEEFSGHQSPQFLPNRLNLLADMGVGAGDHPRVEASLDAFLAHQTDDGRFLAFGRYPIGGDPAWGSLPCDTNAIVDVLLRFGRGDDPRVKRGIERVAATVSATPQGPGWLCVTDSEQGFRGPGRKADVCPQATLEALRALSQMDDAARPQWTLEAARTPLALWLRRADERPYMFGHGYQFKSVKWPSFWYDILWVLETVGRFPELWRGPSARDEDRRALAEMAACLIAYNFDDGLVTPRRVYKGFERFSFGRKGTPSPFATARTLTALARLSDLAEEIAAVDVLALPSSKGGSGTARPPKGV